MRSSPPILLLSACVAAWLGLAGDGAGQAKPADSPSVSSPPAQAILLTARFDRQKIKTFAESEAPVVKLCQSCGCVVGDAHNLHTLRIYSQESPRQAQPRESAARALQDRLAGKPQPVLVPY